MRSRFIVLTAKGFEVVQPVSIGFYASHVHPGVTVGKLRAFAGKWNNNPPKRKKDWHFLIDPKHVGTWAASPHYGARVVTEETKACQAYVEHEPMDATIRVLALYKRDKLLLEVLGMT